MSHHPQPRVDSGVEPWVKELNDPRGPDLREIELAQNIFTGKGVKAGKNTLDAGTVCAVFKCESKLNLRHIEWREVQPLELDGKEDRVIVARFLATIRNLTWCSDHHEVAVQELKTLVRGMLIPRVREGLAQVGKRGAAAEAVAEEGKRLRDTMDRFVDHTRPAQAVHPGYKHFRALFTNLMKAAPNRPGKQGPPEKKRKTEGKNTPVDSPRQGEEPPKLVLRVDLPCTTRHAMLPPTSSRSRGRLEASRTSPGRAGLP